MKIFGNRAINRANMHSAAQALAQGAGGTFVFVFLLRSGMSMPLVLCTIAGMTAGRFALRGAVLPVARRIGLRQALILGTVLEAAIFPLLPLIDGPGVALGVAIIVSALGSVFYWTSYHAYFAALGDAELRGHQVGLREMVTAIIGVIAPLLGGWALVSAGPWIAFSGVALIQAASALPLTGAPEVVIAAEAEGGRRERWFAAALFAADGWFGASFHFLWQVVLFASLDQSFGAFGGATAVAAILGGFGSLGIGRWIDLGHGSRSVNVAYTIAGAAAALKGLSWPAPAFAVIANALGVFAAALLIPALMTRAYNLAKGSPCPLRFHIATEAGWDVGCASGCLTAAGLLHIGAPFSVPLLLALPAAAASWGMLRGLVRPAAKPS
jgi:hypothetical protein